MNRVNIFLVVMSLLFFIATPVSSSPFGLGRCEDTNIFNLFLGGSIGMILGAGGCCVDDCWYGQLLCAPNAQYAYTCGDYDIGLDTDQCYEWPPASPDYWKQCPYGCLQRPGGEVTPYTSGRVGSGGDTCPTENPCAVAGDGCVPGQSRCGRKCPEGQSCVEEGSFVDAVFICKKISVGGAYINQNRQIATRFDEYDIKFYRIINNKN
jgi:hypothetical protein